MIALVFVENSAHLKVDEPVLTMRMGVMGALYSCSP